MIKAHIKVSRSYVWLGSLRQWHWISSALCLIGMLLFALTGITLNHAAQIQVEPKVFTVEIAVPEKIFKKLSEPAEEKAPLPASVRTWLADEYAIDTVGRFAEWSEEEIYLSLPRPGGDAWLSIDLVSGEMLYEKTDRGWISYFNDLHKGRNTGSAWFWFIDIFAVTCLVFCITGLLLLYRHAASRPVTWPIVGLGLVIPLVLAILFIH